LQHTGREDQQGTPEFTEKGTWEIERRPTASKKALPSSARPVPRSKYTAVVESTKQLVEKAAVSPSSAGGSMVELLKPVRGQACLTRAMSVF